MNNTVVAIVSAFFIIGILVGVIVVVAASVLRADRRGDPGDPLDFEPGEPPGRPRGGVASGGRSRWPGDADNDFSGR